MSPVIVTYIGLVVAISIFAWGIIEVGRRYYGRKKIDARVIHKWVPFDPDSPGNMGEAGTQADSDDSDANEQGTIRTRSRQNGHYSESKKFL